MGDISIDSNAHDSVQREPVLLPNVTSHTDYRDVVCLFSNCTENSCVVLC